MGFKSINDYNEEKYGGLFLLRNDGDYADVIFLYQGMKDALVADTHYIKSAEYSGYVHCCGKGCPACAKEIRVQTKLFIPLFNITDGEMQLWDRSIRFESQLNQDVFSHYPNPSEFVFRITRHGAAGDVNTTYQIVAVGKNSATPYDQLLQANGIKFPDFYNQICKEFSVPELFNMLNVQNAASSSSGGDIPSYNYQVTPRTPAGTPAPPSIPVPDAPVDETEDEDLPFSEGPELDDYNPDEPVDF